MRAGIRAGLASVGLIALLDAGSVAMAQAVSTQRGQISATLMDDVRSYLASDIVQMSVRDQNRKYRDRTESDINALDQQWRRENESTAKPLISATLSNPLSAYLTRIQAHSNGVFTEIFVMDNKGLNVGQSSISSDYWQGDEPKWQQTFSAGSGSIFVDEPEWDAKTRSWLAQVNMSVDDSVTKAAIGAATFQVNLTELQRLR